MVAEKALRYPMGTYQVRFFVRDGSSSLLAQNLCTGKRITTGDFWDLVKRIERDLGENRYPQCATQYRAWGLSDGGQADRNHGEEAAAMPEGQALGLSFLINILYRQNATWQGTVQWIEGRQTRNFRSVNELLLLMEEAQAVTGRQNKKKLS